MKPLWLFFALLSTTIALKAAPAKVGEKRLSRGQVTAPVVQLYKTGKFAEAQKILEARLKVEKSSVQKMNLLIALAECHCYWAESLVKSDDFRGAIKHYLRAYETDKTLNKSAAALELVKIGAAYESLGQTENTLLFYIRALPILRAIHEQKGEAITLSRIAITYQNLNQTQNALRYYSLALSVRRQIQDKRGEAFTLNSIGETLFSLSRYEEALRFFKLALPIFRQIKERRDEASALGNIGMQYRNLSRYEEALSYYDQALLIFRTTGDSHNEALILVSIGGTYVGLGQAEKGLHFFRLALPKLRAAKDRQNEALALISMAQAYKSLNEDRKALEHYTLALPITRAIKDRRGEANILNDVGFAIQALNEYKTALLYHKRALDLYRKIKDQLGEASASNNIGLAYFGLGQYQDSLHYYNFSLPLMRAIKYRQGEAVTLSNICMVYQAQNQLDLAIIRGKQSVNLRQSIRHDIQHLPKETQRAYLAANRGIYGLLTSLLVKQNRLEEAEQVLRFLRIEEAFEFIQRDPSLAKDLFMLLKPLSFTPAEKKSLPPSTQVDVAEGELESQIWQQSLRKREEKGAGSAALLSTFNTNEAFYVLLSTAKGRRAFSFPIKKIEFDALSTRLQSELSHPTYDPRRDAQKMYQIVFCDGQLEKALQEDGIEVALWFTSGSLRYIPIDALHDGQQYLVEKPRANVSVTLTSRQLFETSSKGAVLAAGASLPHMVPATIPGDAAHYFSALDNVPREVRAIVRDPQQGGTGPFDGKILLDRDFSAANLEKALAGGAATVHIATHFALGTGGDTDSFLLLGDGQTLPISQWKDKLKLKGVTLLTLSACETGVGRDNATGSEVSSIGEISQWLGAQSVLVSLWPVADPSTAVLMGDFYQRWHDTPTPDKIGALRSAQRAMLGASNAVTVDTPRGQPRRETTDQSRQAFVKDPQHPFSHPFYWAPFTLIGNWR